MIHFDTHELDNLAIEMPRLGRKGFKVMADVMTKGGEDLRDKWRENAKETSGEHGKHYPKSIESHLVISTDIVVEIGPNPAKPQGGMSFEFGSSKQPAHLDGQRAADEILPVIQGRAATALFHMFGLDS